MAKKTTQTLNSAAVKLSDADAAESPDDRSLLARVRARAPVRSERRHNSELFDNALLELLARQSFDKITVRHICAEAGLSEGTFFRYHYDREALLHHVSRETLDLLLEPLLERVPGPDTFRKMCDHIDASRAKSRALLTGGAQGILRDAYLQAARALGERSRVRSWLSPDLAVSCRALLIFEATAWWLKMDTPVETCEDMAALLDRLVNAATAGWREGK